MQPEQPAAIFVSYSVISFIQGNAGGNATCSTPCRREYAAVALSWSEFPQKFRLLFTFAFVLFIGKAKKINDPFPLHGIRHTETRVPMNNYYPNFCRDYALLYHGYLISGNNYVDRSKHKSTFAYEFFSENFWTVDIMQ